MADEAGAIEQGLVVGAEHSVHARTPEVEGEVLLLLGAQLGLFEEDHDQAVEGIDFVCAQVVLGDEDVLLADAGAAPGGERHVGLARIGAGDNELGGGLAGGGVKEFVLHLGEEQHGFLFAGLVVAAEREQVAHLLVKPFLRGPDLTDAGEEFVEVVPAAGILEALVVDDEAFDQVFLEMGAGPLAELDATRGTHAVADGQNEIEAVELDRTLDFPLSLNLNCQGFLDSCLGPQLPVFKDVFGVEGDVLFGGLEQLGDFKLGQPDGLAVDAQVEPGAAVVRGVQDEFAHGATPNCLRIFRRATSVSLASASMTSSSPTISAMGRYVSASEVWI